MRHLLVVITLIGAVSAASAAGIPTAELRGRVNLSYAAAADDPQLAYRTARDGLALARKLGMAGYAFYLIGNAAEMAIRMGDWSWVVPELDEALRAQIDKVAHSTLLGNGNTPVSRNSGSSNVHM